ncbi:hypothetical protein IDJ77_03920 [Mucilaginibacter sp. ZT4R22]|uniref:Uncharacterized protein n=1 Tax=Mucilaginibacter pankratovii TaxID=2772110 RepID=A0ABR7WKV1_9SPHI|nr:hypothetical protein [Mucilaginibacter pankratovii]MBD1362948.1 hypothetical protein [Mucilaginibacter pankratovii]
MYKYLLTILVIFSIQIAFAQTKDDYYYDYQKTSLTSGRVNTILRGINTENLGSLVEQQKDGKKYNLVSKYTFRTLIKGDFAKLTGTDNSATVGQYAALSIDPNTYKLTFSPYAWVPSSSVLQKRNFKNILSFDVGATLNNKSILDLKEWRKVTVAFSWTGVFGVRYGYEVADAETEENHKAPYVQLYSDLTQQFTNGFDAAFKYNELKKRYEVNNRRYAINHSEYADEDGLKGAYLDSIAFYEQAMVKSEWKKKSFWWLKVTANALSFDNADYIVKALPATIDAPLSKATYTPSVSLSINNFWGFASKWSFYWNLNAQLGMKNTFSGIYTPATYYGLSKLSDQAYLENSKKTVYQLDNDEIRTKILPDLGGQFIILYSLKKIGLGLDASYSNKFAISNITGQNTGYISSPSVGFILGLKDKTGKSNINIEPFFNYIDYRNINVKDARLWGIKFSIPVNSLF